MRRLGRWKKIGKRKEKKGRRKYEKIGERRIGRWKQKLEKEKEKKKKKDKAKENMIRFG